MTQLGEQLIKSNMSWIWRSKNWVLLQMRETQGLGRVNSARAMWTRAAAFICHHMLLGHKGWWFWWPCTREVSGETFNSCACSERKPWKLETNSQECCCLLCSGYLQVNKSSWKRGCCHERFLPGEKSCCVLQELSPTKNCKNSRETKR